MKLINRHRQLAYASGISACLFVIVAALRFLGSFHDIDIAAAQCFASLRDGGAIRMLAILTEIFSATALSLILLAAFLILFWSNHRTLALELISSAALGTALFYIVKLLFHAARPEGALIDVSGFGFPSGHATLAAIFFIFIARLVERAGVRHSIRLLFNFLALGLMLGVSLSRIYLGVHWLSDVLGGILLGTFSWSVTTLFIETRTWKPIS